MKRLLFGSGAVVLLVWVDSPLPVTSETVFDVAPGSAFTTVSRNLEDAGILDKSRAFSWYGRLTGDAANIRAGEYVIGPGVTPAVRILSITRSTSPYGNKRSARRKTVSFGRTAGHACAGRRETVLVHDRRGLDVP